MIENDFVVSGDGHVLEPIDLFVTRLPKHLRDRGFTQIKGHMTALDDFVVLQIIDEGGGIPQGELESVFDKFYRVNKGDHVRPGTGLGLAISRGFVEAMHGTISAANRSDRSGAVLTIRLPVPADAKGFSSEVDTAA